MNYDFICTFARPFIKINGRKSNLLWKRRKVDRPTLRESACRDSCSESSSCLP